MSMFEFQIVTDTPKEAHQFMDAVQAQDVNIEEWDYGAGTPSEKSECYGFGTTHYSPKHLKRLTGEMGIVLAYAENQETAEQETEKLVQRVMEAGEIIKAMNLTSEQEMMYHISEICKRLAMGVS
jgi:D-tyrosyl-tRNA(Tyr) deacylase